MIPKCLALISEKQQNWYLGQPDLQLVVKNYLKRWWVNILDIRGHSTTTWTNLDPILTQFDHRPPSSGQASTFYISPTFVHVDKSIYYPPSYHAWVHKRGLLSDPPPPSSCPRSCWMTQHENVHSKWFQILTAKTRRGCYSDLNPKVLINYLYLNVLDCLPAPPNFWYCVFSFFNVCTKLSWLKKFWPRNSG